MARISFCDSAWSHPPQVNQNLPEVEPRKPVFKCFLHGSDDQARVGSPAMCLPSSEAGVRRDVGDTATSACIQACQASFLKGVLHSETSVVIFHLPTPPQKKAHEHNEEVNELLW